MQSSMGRRTKLLPRDSANNKKKGSKIKNRGEKVEIKRINRLYSVVSLPLIN